MQPHPSGDARDAVDRWIQAELAVERVLGWGDDALIAAQRLSGWIARCPTLEEDVAVANLGLDLLGQARLLLGHAGSLMDPARSEDDLAYWREERELRNVQLVERPLGDFAVVIVRHLLLAAYQLELYRSLQADPDPVVAGVAAKAVKEVAYHRDHTRLWTLRLGGGTPESHARMEAALAEEWRYWPELYDGAAHLREPATAWVTGVLAEATLAVPDVTPAVTGGRRGIHTESFGYLLAEMQHLARSHPGAQW